MNLHPFDQALQLTSAEPHVFTGASARPYWNMVGPFGGMTAATALNAVLQHPALLGEPIALTVNYAGPVAAGPFKVSATPARTNRSTQHWVISLSQTNAEGADEVMLTGTAVTAARRSTWSHNDEAMPQVPGPAELPVGKSVRVLEWLNRYEMRFVQGNIPVEWHGGGETSLSQLWVRDNPPRPLDFCSLAALADVFFPRVYLRRAVLVPAGTVSMTVYFHANSEQLTQSGSGFLLAQARAQAFSDGFFDQTAQLWNESGALLATSHQIVYFKE
ncbi:MAG: thioesterase family protein [Rhodoferax sp.]|jgi:acyl-CoA thioesterase|nr:thioesterase family protein [Rhodoferax sp.]